MLRLDDIITIVQTRNRELVKFAEIRLISAKWPKFQPTGTPLDQTEYEENDYGENKQEYNCHAYMMMLKEPVGLTLLDNYAGYPTWASAVALGVMPEEWTMWKMICERQLSPIEKIQLALFTSLRRMSEEEQDMGDLFQTLPFYPILRAIGFLIHLTDSEASAESLQGDDSVTNNDVIAILKEIGDAFPSRTATEVSFLRDLVRTAFAVNKNEEFSHFLEENETELQIMDSLENDQLQGQIFCLSEGDFFSLYWSWYANESFVVQIILTLVLMVLIGESDWSRFEDRTELRSQITRIVRGCSELVSFSSRERQTSVYSFLMKQNPAEEEVRNKSVRNSLAFRIAYLIAGNICCRLQELNESDPEARMAPEAYEATEIICFGHTLTYLGLFGNMTSHFSRETRIG